MAPYLSECCLWVGTSVLPSQSHSQPLWGWLLLHGHCDITSGRGTIPISCGEGSDRVCSSLHLLFFQIHFLFCALLCFSEGEAFGIASVGWIQARAVRRVAGRKNHEIEGKVDKKFQIFFFCQSCLLWSNSYTQLCPSMCFRSYHSH